MKLTGGGTDEGIRKAMGNDRFDLGVAGRGFEGADLQDVSSDFDRWPVLMRLTNYR